MIRTAAIVLGLLVVACCGRPRAPPPRLIVTVDHVPVEVSCLRTPPPRPSQDARAALSSAPMAPEARVDALTAEVAALRSYARSAWYRCAVAYEERSR